MGTDKQWWKKKVRSKGERNGKQTATNKINK